MKLIAYIVVICCTVAGCATTPHPWTVSENRGAIERLQTSDPQELSKRWGAWNYLLKGNWIYNYQSNNVTAGKLVIDWLIPGVVLRTNVPIFGMHDTQHHFFDSATNQIRVFSSSAEVGELGVGSVQADGSVIYKQALSNTNILKFDSLTGLVKLDRNRHYPLTYLQVDAARFAQIDAEIADNQEAEKIRRDGARRELWSNIASGITAAAQVAAHATQAAASEHAALTASRQRNIPTVQEALAASELRIAQNQTRQRQASQQNASAAGTVQQAGPDQYSRSLQAQNAEIERLKRQRLTEEQRYQQQVVAVVPRSPVVQERVMQASPTVRRGAYPEAITVCTKPTGPKQSFECRSPLNVQRGHAEDITGHRTPEELANGEACPDMRRLASSTHLVWACGFGATGANNAIDRSAGVDVQGRRTFYCTDREFSCRRTEP